MQRNMRIILSLLGLIALLQAGTSGKLTGIITDENNTPLIGVNVFIENSSMGGSTDENGFYAILNVPPGTYTIVASYIGYKTVRVSEIGVSIDLTRYVDIQMDPEIISSGEEVLVVAQRSLLNQDEFSSKHIVSSEEMEVQPIESIISIAQNQAGTVGSNFRGGRSGEVLVVIDGIPIRDPSAGYTGDFGGFTLNVPKDAVQEMEVSLGGFSAEYGNVQSGVLNLAMKEGSERFSGSLYSTTTNFGSLNESLMAKDPWRLDAKYQQKLENNYRFSLSGPIVSGLTFAISGDILDRQQGYYLNQDAYNQSYQGKVSYKISNNAHIAVGGNITRQKWNSFYFQAGKYGPGDNYQSDIYEFIEDLTATNDTLTRYLYVENALDTTQFQSGLIDSLLSPYFIQLNDSDSVAVHYHKNIYLDAPMNHLTSRVKESNQLYGVFTYTFSSKTFLELSAQMLSSSYQNGMKDYADRDGDGDTEELLQWDRAVEGPRPERRVREYEFWWLSGDDSEYRDQEVNSYLVKGDLTSQLDQYHMLKTGWQFNWNNTKVTDITWSSVVEDADYALNTLRKDIWEKNDMDLGVYVQDKMEFKDALVTLVGLRYDYFDPNGTGDPILYPGNMSNPVLGYDSLGYAIFNDPQEAKPSHQLSPRIGISHPISDRDILFFTYGHYFQRPDGRYLFRNYQYQSLTKVGNWVGNPALKPEKTVAYDISFEHLFTPNLKMSITGYFKDVSDLVNNEKFVFPDGTEVNQYVNGDYANVKGAELAVKRQKQGFWSLQGNISYSIATGRNSSSGGVKLYPFDKKMYPLDFDRRISSNVNLGLYSNKGLPVMQALTRDWVANFQYEYGTGKPYTSYGVLGASNDQRLPSFHNLDIRLSRSIELNMVSLQLNLDIYNALNNDVIQGIYTSYLNQNEEVGEDNPPDIIYQEALSGLIIRTPLIYPSERQFKLGLSLKF
ncbi:MAG: TonB-dependent receptor [Candidatus Marinimicrobia bacterium]|nr:TonB-dependent receptor [Candidatus Neomarinimicrobiota bacterium]